jgi:hypothetical protein
MFFVWGAYFAAVLIGTFVAIIFISRKFSAVLPKKLYKRMKKVNFLNSTHINRSPPEESRYCLRLLE